MFDLIKKDELYTKTEIYNLCNSLIMLGLNNPFDDTTDINEEVFNNVINLNRDIDNNVIKAGEIKESKLDIVYRSSIIC